MDGTKLTLDIYIKVFDSLYLIFVSNGILSASQDSKESENSDPVDLNRIYYQKNQVVWMEGYHDDGQLRGTRTGPMFFPLANFSKSPRSLHGFK